MHSSGSLVKKLCFGLAILSILAAAGCGYGGSVILPHPTGNYSNASLKGQYVYQVHGNSQVGFYRESGVLFADGAGNISAPSTDDFSNGSLATNSISGTYNIASDGTGFVTLISTGLGHAVGAAQITLAVTLVSPSKLTLMEADSFADGAGIAELQDATVTGTIPSGTFAFRVHEAYATLLGVNFAAEAGVVTLSAGGAVTNGSMDQNLNGSTSPLTLTGTLSPPGAPATMGRGMGTFTDSSGSTTSFVYYIVNAGKVNFLVFQVSTGGTNNVAFGSGSAELQSGTVGNGFSGSYAFGSRGDDGHSFDGVATVGQFTASGATISSGIYDSMQDGTYSASVNFTGTPTTSSNNPSPQGRVQVTLSSGTVEDFWMVSPSRAFFVTESSSKIEDGTVDLQTTNSFSKATLKGQFAMVMDGADLTQLPLVGRLARVGTLQFDGAGKLTLTEEVNASNSGLGAVNRLLTGTYQTSSNGRIVGSLSNSIGNLNVVMYAISGSDVYTLQIDPFTNTSGTAELQH